MTRMGHALVLCVVLTGCPEQEAPSAETPPDGAAERDKDRAAIEQLYKLHKAQHYFHMLKSEYGSLEQLAKAGKIADGLASGSLEGRRLEVKVIPSVGGWPPKSGKWMAVAHPAEKGGAWLGVNLLGVWRAEREIALVESCDMPDHARPLDPAEVALKGARTLLMAQGDYHKKHKRYATLEQLVAFIDGGGGSYVINKSVITAPRWGYRYQAAPSTKEPDQMFWVLVSPIEGVTGKAFFASHQEERPLPFKTAPKVDPASCQPR